MNVIKDLIRLDLPNLAIANINYRLANQSEKPYPMQIEDITSIINFLKENKAKFTISENIGFIGTSAGAHLSLLWSYAFDDNKKVNMVCSIVGPTNFTDPALQDMLNLFGINQNLFFRRSKSILSSNWNCSSNNFVLWWTRPFNPYNSRNRFKR
jgi:acetyl esterase/lipase